MLIRTADGVSPHATLHDARSDRALLIASAMGVKRRYYDAFAQYLAARGISVVTFDYRGIGESRPASLRGFDATMLDWGHYLFRDVDPALYTRLTAPVLSYSLRDDKYAPKRAVDALAARYPNVTRVHLAERGLGHFDFFRKGREPLWEDVLRC